ncbi:MAG: hypothetical protein WCT12_28155 [Verrucomicrobiota bacterium]
MSIHLPGGSVDACVSGFGANVHLLNVTITRTDNNGNRLVVGAAEQAPLTLYRYKPVQPPDCFYNAVFGLAHRCASKLVVQSF